MLATIRFSDSVHVLTIDDTSDTWTAICSATNVCVENPQGIVYDVNFWEESGRIVCDVYSVYVRDGILNTDTSNWIRAAIISIL